MMLYLRSARSWTLDILPFDWQDIRSRRCRLEVFFQRRPGRSGPFLERSNPPHMLVNFIADCLREMKLEAQPFSTTSVNNR